MKYVKAIIYVIIIHVVIASLSVLFDDSYERTAIYLLIGMVAGILAGLSKEDE